MRFSEMIFCNRSSFKGGRYGVSADGGWDGGAAVHGQNDSGCAGYFQGKVRLTGELEKAGWRFQD